MPTGFYTQHICPCLLHLAMMHKSLRPYRERVVGGASGRVLEIGVGSGLNWPLYNSAADCVVGLDPSPSVLRRATQKAARAHIPVQLLEGSAEDLPFEGASFDTIVTTWTLCTIQDASRALTEMRRVLRPQGLLLFVEHGRAPEPRVAWWQDRLDPLWSWIAAGCHLNRRIDALIGAKFRFEALRNTRLPGPRTHTYLYEGRARPV
ncbi:MAG: class I SAM-dependent methyltransferase [Acetobacteraceae bacterium]|nr:class I SAM-dependent methyltransferase [Acetobacteraceae bacterium]